jgi:hypothetical protein
MLRWQGWNFGLELRMSLEIAEWKKQRRGFEDSTDEGVKEEPGSVKKAELSEADSEGRTIEKDEDLPDFVTTDDERVSEPFDVYEPPCGDAANCHGILTLSYKE